LIVDGFNFEKIIPGKIESEVKWFMFGNLVSQK